jgi:hypothetical protein
MIRRVLVAAAMGAALLAGAAVCGLPALAADAAATTATGALTTAQPLGSSVVNLSPLVATIWQIGLAVLGVVGPWLVVNVLRWFSNKTHIALSDQAQADLERAFKMGVNLAATRLQTHFGGKLTVDVHNQLAATVVNYVLDHADPALKQLGIDPTKNAQRIAESALARLSDAGIVPSAAGPIDVHVPAVPPAPAIGLLSGPGVAPAPAAAPA